MRWTEVDLNNIPIMLMFYKRVKMQMNMFKNTGKK